MVTAIRAGDVDAFAVLYGHFNPGLGRYLRFRAPGRAEQLGDAVWRGVLGQLANFAGTEKDFRLLLYLVARRQLSELGIADHPERGEGWLLPTHPVDQAIALLGSSLGVDGGQVVILRVVADLDIEDSAHVLRSTTGAVRLAQYRALVTLVYQFSNRRGAAPPSDETLSSFLDVSDPTPNLVFQGALPPWQARGSLAPVARLVAAARRRPADEERHVTPALHGAVEDLARQAGAPAIERRVRWTWTPGDRRARPRTPVVTGNER